MSKGVIFVNITDMKKDTIFKLIDQEIKRQKDGLVMIASENYAPVAVLKAMGTPLSNKYSEGYPGKRYYSGNKFIDQIEELAQSRALDLFNLSSQKWQANVQPHSGSSANLAAYMALLKPGDKILGMDLSAGGHLTHGSPVNFSGKLFKFVYYGVNNKTGKLDYSEIRRIAKREKPKMIICGATAYTQKINFKKFAQIAKGCRALLLADIAHIVGLVVAGAHPSPLPHADIVTSTTHKTLAGPRGAFIIGRKDLMRLVDKAVFPGMQGGPLDHVTAAKAICFSLAKTEKFKKYQLQIVKNARVLASSLQKAGIKLVADSTENHIVLIDCQSLGVSGKIGANLLADVGIYANANMIPFDPATPLNPSGIRLGTPALTARKMKEKEMRLVGGLIADILLNPNDGQVKKTVKSQVLKLTKKFPIYKNEKWC